MAARDPLPASVPECEIQIGPLDLSGLTDEQRAEIEAAEAVVLEYEAGHLQGIPHDEVMARLRARGGGANE